MKRFIALVLALLMPMCALAETTELSIRVEASDSLIDTLLGGLPKEITASYAASIEKYAGLINALIKDATLHAVVQEDACAMDFTLNSVQLLDLVVYEANGLSYMTSSVIPGYVLESPAEEEATSEAPDAAKLEKIADEAETAFTKWREGLTATTSTGSFSGDAYTGGTECTTWVITDSDIAALMSALMTDNLRSVLSAMYGTTDDEPHPLDAFDAANERVAREDKYSYLVRRVKNASGEAVGVSVTVFEQEVQLATLSIGKTGESHRLVVGLGLKDRNYWLECALTRSQREASAFIKGEVREWMATKNESFAYVRETNAPAASGLLQCNLTAAGARRHMDAHLYRGADAAADKEVCAVSGSINVETAELDLSFRLLDKESELLALSITSRAAEEIPALDPSLIRCSADDPDDQEKYTELMQIFSASIALRLMQAIPFNAVLQLQTLFQ